MTKNVEHFIITATPSAHRVTYARTQEEYKQKETKLVTRRVCVCVCVCVCLHARYVHVCVCVCVWGGGGGGAPLADSLSLVHKINCHVVQIVHTNNEPWPNSYKHVTLIEANAKE